MAGVIGRYLNARRGNPPVSYASAPGALLNQVQTNPAKRNLKTVTQVGTVYQVVYTMASAVANAEWTLIRAPRPNDDPEAPPTPVFAHPALNLWLNPNPFMTTSEFVETAQVWFELTGECYIYVVKQGGIPVEIWPLDPTKIRPDCDENTFIRGWLYTDPGTTTERSLPLADVIQIRIPNPSDMYRGLSPLPSLMADIESNRFGAEYVRNYFTNSAEPRGVIETDSKIKTEEIDKLQRQWHERHRGVQNANRVAILPQGTSWKTTEPSFKDMQFAESRELSRDVIREGFGVSKTLLGVSESVNRATAEAAEYVFAKHKRNPRLKRWQQALNRHFLPMFGTSGQGVQFVFDPDIPEDENAEITAKANAALALSNAGYDKADICRVVGLPQMRIAEPVTNPQEEVPSGGIASEDEDESDG